MVIQNFALIEEMDVHFPGGLSIITGETGAGKSIFLEALALSLGKRADLSSLRNKDKKCIIEAEFDVRRLKLETFLKEQELEAEPVLTLRREISSDGKSRCFVNDALVSLNTLKELSDYLVDVHSQHQTLQLNKSDFQFDLLDAFAGSTLQMAEFSAQFNSLQQLKKDLFRYEEEEAKARKDEDYYSFLFQELEQSEIAPGLLKQFEEQSTSLENAELIRAQLSRSAFGIQEGEQNILTGLNLVKQNVQSLSRYGEPYREYGERLQAVYIELKELAADLDQAASRVLVDPKKLEEVNLKMDKLNRLLKKHQVNDESDLLKIKTDIGEKLQELGSLEEKINKAKKELDKQNKALNSKAKELSEKRMKAIPEIEKRVKTMLKDLGMEHAVFKIDLRLLTEPGPKGADELRFLFSANKGEAPGELQKIASGGELSRLMLSLKALLAEKKSLPSIVFDEIDTGVSGEVADRIGGILSKMGKNMQVISITHLPQIASKGSHHLFVYKKDNSEKTLSYIKELNKEERTVEIAKMLSTGKPTDSAIKNALELLNAN